MDAQTHEDSPLPYILLRPEDLDPGAEYPLIILMHGRGSNMHDLAGLASVLDEKGYFYAFPNAPYQMQVGPGMTGYSWVTGQPGVEDPAPGSPLLPELLDGFLGEVSQEAGTPAGKIILGGFSQGGDVTLRYGLPRPAIFAGLAVLSGAFRNREDVEAQLPAERNQPIFIAHGRFDQVLPLEHGHETRDFLVGAGYSPVFKEYDMAHEVSGGVIGDLVPWLQTTLPPKT